MTGHGWEKERCMCCYLGGKLKCEHGFSLLTKLIWWSALLYNENKVQQKKLVKRVTFYGVQQKNVIL